MFLQEGSKSWEFYLQTPYLAIPETRFHIKNRGLRFGRVGNLPAWVAGTKHTSSHTSKTCFYNISSDGRSMQPGPLRRLYPSGNTRSSLRPGGPLLRVSPYSRGQYELSAVWSIATEINGAVSRIRTGTVYVLNVLPLPKLGYHGIQIGAQGEIRTHTVLCLRQAPPASWATWA